MADPVNNQSTSSWLWDNTIGYFYSPPVAEEPAPEVVHVNSFPEDSSYTTIEKIPDDNDSTLLSKIGSSLWNYTVGPVYDYVTQKPEEYAVSHPLVASALTYLPFQSEVDSPVVPDVVAFVELPVSEIPNESDELIEVYLTSNVETGETQDQFGNSFVEYLFPDLGQSFDEGGVTYVMPEPRASRVDEEDVDVKELVAAKPKKDEPAEVVAASEDVLSLDGGDAEVGEDLLIDDYPTSPREVIVAALSEPAVNVSEGDDGLVVAARNQSVADQKETQNTVAVVDSNEVTPSANNVVTTANPAVVVSNPVATNSNGVDRTEVSVVNVDGASKVYLPIAPVNDAPFFVLGGSQLVSPAPSVNDTLAGNPSSAMVTESPATLARDAAPGTANNSVVQADGFPVGMFQTVLADNSNPISIVVFSGTSTRNQREPIAVTTVPSSVPVAELDPRFVSKGVQEQAGGAAAVGANRDRGNSGAASSVTELGNSKIGRELYVVTSKRGGQTEQGMGGSGSQNGSQYPTEAPRAVRAEGVVASAEVVDVANHDEFKAAELVFPFAIPNRSTVSPLFA